MSASLPRRNFLWSGLDLPFIVEARIDDARITLRTWRLSADAPLANVMPEDEAAEKLAPHAAPFEVEPDPLGTTRSGRDLWVPLQALGGLIRPGSRSSNLFVKPVSQTGFVIDPAITGSGAWSDYGFWLFNARRDGSLQVPFNRYVETTDSKAHRQLLLTARQETNLMILCVPFAGESFESCSIILKYNGALGCVHNLASPYDMPPVSIGWGSYDMEAVFGVKALLPSLRLLGPDTIAAGQSAAFTVELFERNTGALITDSSPRIYLEASAGYLAQRQVYIAGGSATAGLTALGLEAGETIKLKVGWRHFSGAAEKIVTVV